MTKEFIRFKKLLEEKKYALAQRIADECLNKGDDSFWLTQRARVLNLRGKHVEALQAAERALELAPSNGYALISVADAHFALNNLSEACEYYREALRNPRLGVIATQKLLATLSRMQQWEEVLDLPTRYSLPEDVVFPHKVKALRGLNRQEEAMAACREWTEYNPDNPQAVRTRFELEVEQLGIDVVLENLSRMLQIRSLAPIYREVYISLCEKAGKMEEAGRELAVLRGQSSDPWVHRRTAFNLAKQGKPEAVALLEELMRSSPEDPYLHASYSSLCRRLGMYEHAREFYSLLLEKYPEAKSLLGRIRKMAGQREQDHR